MTITQVSSEEYDALVARLEARRRAVAKAQRAVAAATTLAEKIAAKRAIAVARAIKV